MFSNITSRIVRTFDSATLSTRSDRGLSVLMGSVAGFVVELERTKSEAQREASRLPKEGRVAVLEQYRSIVAAADSGTELTHTLLAGVNEETGRYQLTRQVAQALMSRAQNFRDELIREAFPDLRSFPPRIDCARDLDSVVSHQRGRFRDVVRVNPKLLTSSKDVLTGGLAYEMALLTVSKLPGFSQAPDIAKKAESLVLRRGYGYQLLAYVEWQSQRDDLSTSLMANRLTELRRLLGWTGRSGESS